MKSNKVLNTLLNGDCLQELNSIPEESIDLIYLDPPFFTQRTHKLKNKKGDKTFSFNDEWESIEAYVNFIKVRLVVLKKKLKPAGSLFLHCDKAASHYLKIALDQIFGMDQFRSEIVWSYKRWANSKKGLLNNHQIIFFYSKSNEFKFNTVFEKYSITTNVDQIVQKRTRDDRNKSVYKKDLRTGQPDLVSSKDGVPLGDVWSIPFLNPKARERVSYPTQKPILLIEKILEIATDKGDVVLDPFCGSGTTLVTAKMMGRHFIGIDVSQDALSLTKQRLENPIRTESAFLKKGEMAYDKQSTTVKDIVTNLKATLVHRNKGIDGLISSQKIIVPFKVVSDLSFIENDAQSLCKSTLKNKYPSKALFSKEKISTQMAKNILQKYDVLIFNSLKDLERKLKLRLS
jgi:site-specific DNA-methyltransferase (adenine-specific)